MTVTSDSDFTAVPSLLYSETEEDLRQVIRRMADELSPWSAVVSRLDQAIVHDPRLWRALTEAGIAGLLVPERLGGSGAGAREMAVALEEAGRAVAPVPLLTSSVLAAVTLLSVGSPGEALLTTLASGAAIAGVVVNGGRAWEPGVTEAFQFHDSGDGSCHVTGFIGGVVGVEKADWLLVPANDGHALVLVAVDVRDAGATVRPAASLDMTRPLATVELSHAAGSVLARGAEAADALKAGLVAGTVLLASEQLGVAERALELACDHLRTRHQFGRLLGSFQSLRHRAADLWTALTDARAVARYAAACLADGASDVELAAHLAQAVCADVALDTTEACLQMMGGIGFTWENPTHLLLKRAVASHALFGTPERHRQQIGHLRGLPAVGG